VLAGGGTFQQLQADFLGSTEYFQGFGQETNAGYLAALYLDALGRPGDAQGLAYYLSALALGASRTAIAPDLLTSPEGDTANIQNLYAHFLGRAVDPQGLQYWLETSQTGTSMDLIASSICASDEYFEHSA
jgi:Domain of unknown function (DUF4214)